MGPIREALEQSIEAAIDLDRLEPDKHAAIIAGARLSADQLDTEPATASMLSTYLNFCKQLGVVPATATSQVPVVGAGRVASMRAHSRARLKAV